MAQWLGACVVTQEKQKPQRLGETAGRQIESALTVKVGQARIAPLTPASLHSAGDDRQNGPAGGGYYHLADDGAVVEAPQGWDQGLED